MNAHTTKGGASSIWNPEPRPDGSVEVTARYFDPTVGRIVWGNISPERYVELFDRGDLGWQIENKERPEHNPPREEVVDFLEKEKEKKPKQISTWSRGIEQVLKEPIQRPQLGSGWEGEVIVASPESQQRIPRQEKINALVAAKLALQNRGKMVTAASLVREALRPGAQLAGKTSVSALSAFVYGIATREEKEKMGLGDT